MPGRRYGRRYSKRRKFYRRGRAGGLRRQVKSLARKVRGVRKTIETKRIEQIYPTQSFPAIGTATSNMIPWVTGNTVVPYFCLTTMDEGYNGQTRDGTSIKLTSLDAFLRLTTNNLSAIVMNVRMIVFQDRRYDGSTGNLPTPANLLQNTAVAFNLIGSPLNWDTRKRYRILKDKWFKLSDQWSFGTPTNYVVQTNPQSELIYKFHMKLNKIARFKNATGNGIADALQGHIFVMFLTDYGGVNGPYLDFQYRLKFQG